MSQCHWTAWRLGPERMGKQEFREKKNNCGNFLTLSFRSFPSHPLLGFFWVLFGLRYNIHIRVSCCLEYSPGKKHPFRGQGTVLDEWLRDQAHPESVLLATAGFQIFALFLGVYCQEKKKKAQSLSHFPCTILVNALQQMMAPVYLTEV